MPGWVATTVALMLVLGLMPQMVRPFRPLPEEQLKDAVVVILAQTTTTADVNASGNAIGPSGRSERAAGLQRQKDDGEHSCPACYVGMHTAHAHSSCLLPLPSIGRQPAMDHGANLSLTLLLHALATGPIRLLLCECEPTQGPPNGLGCSKEGWFISNFENQGTWVSQICSQRLIYVWKLRCLLGRSRQ